MRTYTTVSVTFPPSLLSRAMAIAEREQRSMSELLREAFRTCERSRPGDAEEEAETARRIKASQAAVRRGEYTDYHEVGVRNLAKNIITNVRKEKTGRKKRG
jgi:predicted transcriptional regulator